MINFPDARRLAQLAMNLLDMPVDGGSRAAVDKSSGGASGGNSSGAAVGGSGAPAVD